MQLFIHQHWEKYISKGNYEITVEILWRRLIFLDFLLFHFLKYIFGFLSEVWLVSFLDVIQILFRVRNLYSQVWKVKIFFRNIYSLYSNSYFWLTVMEVHYGFLCMILGRHKFTVYPFIFRGKIWILKVKNLVTLSL
jgi:hypothetical protein